MLDYFGISELNLGKNNINYFVSRSISRELKLNEDNEFSSEAKISFKNNNNNLSYKTYLQIILPYGSRVQKISIGGRVVEVRVAVVDPSIYENANFRTSDGIEVEQINQGDKTIFGFLVNVPPQAVRVISFSYLPPFKFTDQENFAKYSLFVYKQPGVDAIPFEQKFNLPNDFKILPNDSISV